MVTRNLARLRELMQQHKIDAYLIPSTDPHQSEYVPAMWERRKWMSGFTGSAGDLAVTLEKAGLWTDSRYFLQAEEQLKGSTIELFKMGLPGVPSMEMWLKNVLPPEARIGIDPRLFSVDQYRSFNAFFREWNITVVSVEDNLVDLIWDDQPDFPTHPVRPLDEKFAGESLSSKLKRLREKMQDEKCDLHVLTTLDSLAWLFNIRSSDIEFNPVTIAYAVISVNEAYLFTDLRKITEETQKHFGGEVKVMDYSEFKPELSELASSATKIWLDGGNVSKWVADIAEDVCRQVLYKESPVTMFKAIKNPTEIEGFKNSHIRDGVAMVKFLKWLEENVPSGKVTELSAAARLEEFRKEQEHFRGLSFNTITSYGAHGAIIHYESTPETDVPLKPEGIYLIDSGGQYLDGTTDITRTIALGKPTAEQKENFTRVLAGMIRLSACSFPQGTAGKQLDTIAREPLWEAGLNFGHGVGHGVGHYLNVHEGPQAISYYRCTGVPLEPGMINSNEPGYYKEGEYGMRIENIILTVEDPERSSQDFTFYKFETLTLCPIDLQLIEKKFLTANELKFLNDYHLRVRETLTPFLSAEAKEWLIAHTEPI